MEQDKAGRKGIVCVPVWHRGGGDVSRVPQYTEILRFSTATIRARVAVGVGYNAKVPRSPSDQNRSCSSLNCLST